MFKYILALVLMIHSEIDTYAQIDLNKFNYQRAETILRDSVFYPQKLWRNYNISENDNVDFLIIPLVDFKENANMYDPSSSLLNFIKVINDTYFAFVISNDKFIGTIEAEYEMQYERINIDSITIKAFTKEDYVDLLYNKNLKPLKKGWNLTIYTIFPSSGKHAMESFYTDYKVYEIMNKPCFYFKRSKWEIWFIDTCGLLAYTYKNQYYEEKELIKGIRKVSSDSGVYYVFEYRNVD